MSASGADQPIETVAPYPEPEAGYGRQVVHLPSVDQEDDLLVELHVGKTVSPGAAQQAFGGDLEKRTLQGWGYDYYRVDGIKTLPAPLMGYSDAAMEDVFVPVNFGRGILQRYNSKLPIVFYVPQGFFVRYRIWRAASQFYPAIFK